MLLLVSFACGEPEFGEEEDLGEHLDAASFVSTRDYQLRSYARNKCLAASTAGVLYLATCNTASTQQKFKAVAMTSFYFQVKMAGTHRPVKLFNYFRLMAWNRKCLRRSGSSVVLATCATEGPQAWYAGGNLGTHDVIGNFYGLDGRTSGPGGERVVYGSTEKYRAMIRDNTYFMAAGTSAPYASLQAHVDHLGDELWWKITRL